jgi:ubiquinone/menaquinone biosynthesis C-methylase UbiE
VAEGNQTITHTLQKADIHEGWFKTYYQSDENKKNITEIFDYITHSLQAPMNARVLDAGCGSCFNSILLAERGFSIVGVDFSIAALKVGEHFLHSEHRDAIHIGCSDILRLPFADNTFNYILCYGVLMHIADIEGAVCELSRVIKPGGKLVIYENNTRSLENNIIIPLRLFLGKLSIIQQLRGMPRKQTQVKQTPSGREIWHTWGTNIHLIRVTNIPWLIGRFAQENLVVTQHVAGYFTELHTIVPAFLHKHVCAFNRFWFSHIQTPSLAFGNVLIFEKAA